MHRLALFAAILIAGCAQRPCAAAAPIGFSGAEFHKLSWGAHNMRVGDVNGDGRNDIVVVNNAKARVECLLQRAEPGAAPDPDDLEPNEIADDKRFQSRPFLSEKRVFSLELGDLNGDGRVDMAYYGEPMELVVVYQNARGEWGRRRTFDISDGARRPHCLAIGDVNGDGRNDLVLLGDDGTYFACQDKRGRLQTPVKESGVPPGVVGIVLRDFNGDKRLDILYLSFSEPEPVCIRFQEKDGRLGPEIRARADPLRAVGFGDPDGDGSDDIVAIKLKSGRVVSLDVAFDEDNHHLLSGAMERYTLRNVGPGRSPALALGAFTDPKHLDIAVTAPEANEIEMLFHTPSGHWSRRVAFPTLEGVTQLVAIDVDGDGRDELLVLSPKESILGRARIDARGRLTFPRALNVTGTPRAAMTADLDGDGKPEIIYAAGKDRRYFLRVLARNGDDGFRETHAVEISGASEPEGLLAMDLNQDGRKDVCVFVFHEGMRVFKATADGALVDVSRKPDYGKGLVQGAMRRHVGVADVDGDGKPELLLARKNFARALRMDGRDRLTVVDQFNGRLPSSSIAGVAGADLDGDGAAELILVDSGTRCISVLKRNAMGVYEIRENLRTPPLALERIVVRDLTGDGRNEILLLTKNGCRVLRPGRPRMVLREVAAYETPARNGQLIDVVLGDLDGDGADELVITEAARHALEIVRWQKQKRTLRRTLTWPIYEAKSYAGSRFGKDAARGVEPREFLIADVTGDKKSDIILLIHDRVLVYPQE